MTHRPQKHSLTLHGHRTSVSLEPEFWKAFQEIAAARGMPLNALAAEIDNARGVDRGLASAIRVYVLEYTKTHAKS
ncbi:Ribbon-helix-helix domain-containing protein [Aliiroseovarius halocynthiae]|uniref:Ribbon-helix-helix domain-containing protein n=1 Tax=Aliiroseovarius halocynthiae TaxID=985055 RepID=A0A545SVE8_9RHOB|nr:ribbon-helix-helix domain-containing protein [Aliiroseovarius halocynthiae]TQV68941.1 ribbon-helix-helix domain-containing protein [Aliiroseovarius halocynthiae]SMR71632.1 Ribbon-helix-helix domain-containing protein [Aliiroseovarius halocynthiae]